MGADNSLPDNVITLKAMLRAERAALSLPETQSVRSAVTNRLMLAGDGRSLQIDLVGGYWAIPVSDIPGSRKSGASAPVEHAPPQVSGSFGWRDAPRYVVRDRDRAYGSEFTRRIRAMGSRDRPISARSPWQNGYVERLIGSIRRECLDHVVVLGERHMRNLLRSYQQYYNECRTHLSLDKDAPLARAVTTYGRITVSPVLGGLHHRYCRV